MRYIFALAVLLQGCDASNGLVTDADGDGFDAYAHGGLDCDDSDAGVHPEADEVCDGLDNNCAGGVDEGVTTTYWLDHDGDGYGDPETEIDGCEGGASYVEVAGDCDDADPRVNPDASEVCDGVDNDCDGSTDAADAAGSMVWYADADEDGFGDDNDTVTACDAPEGYVATGGDCDDDDPSTHPSASESCTGGVDSNCDGYTGSGDSDGDGSAACMDCDDGDASIHPGAVETCDGVDEDCDGEVDEDFDVDGDGSSGCAGDCDDTDDTVYPGATEIPYDEIDQNCDGADLTDVDGDGYDAEEAGGTDCDDQDVLIHPGLSVDPLDGVDNDCDGELDEGPFSVDYETDIQPIWNGNCLETCHGRVVPPNGLDLDPGQSWADLVDEPSWDVPSMDRVEPGSPSDSYLWHKLNNTFLSVGGTGSSMPKGAPLLPQSERDLIEQWILEGAPP